MTKVCDEGVWLSKRGFDTCIVWWWRHIGCVFTWLVQSERGSWHTALPVEVRWSGEEDIKAAFKGLWAYLRSLHDSEMFLSWLHAENKLDMSFQFISISRLWFVAQGDFVLCVLRRRFMICSSCLCMSLCLLKPTCMHTQSFVTL